jgi:hypothetical protein
MAKATGFFTTVSEHKFDPVPIEDWLRESGHTVQADSILREVERLARFYRSSRAAWNHAPNSPDLCKWLTDFSGHAKALTELLGERSDVAAAGERIVSNAIGDIMGSGVLHANLLSAADGCDRAIDRLSGPVDRGEDADVPWNNLVYGLAELYKEVTGNDFGFKSQRLGADDFVRHGSRKPFLQFLRAVLQAIGEPEQGSAATFEKRVGRALDKIRSNPQNPV